MSASGWGENRDTMPAARVFEYTDESVAAGFQLENQPDFERLIRLPALFAEEHRQERGSQVVKVGTILRAQIVGRQLLLDYSYDPTIPAITNETLAEISLDLGITEWEMSRTHWAVKSNDLFRALLRATKPRRNTPRVFALQDPERIEPTLVSVMMPFDSAFDPVYETLRTAAANEELHCRRADDIWENPAVIQDVVSLIDRSRIVIADCTGRNPNVFYEIGIAHTLGREVILITQADSDIPFDLRHLRYVRYLNNGEGRDALRERLEPRLAALTGNG